jgi:hypothetical protein
MFMDRMLKIVKISVLPYMVCRFIAMPIKIPTSLFFYIGKLILKFIWTGKKPRICNTILREGN